MGPVTSLLTRCSECSTRGTKQSRYVRAKQWVSGGVAGGFSTARKQWRWASFTATSVGYVIEIKWDRRPQ